MIKTNEEQISKTDIIIFCGTIILAISYLTLWIPVSYFMAKEWASLVFSDFESGMFVYWKNFSIILLTILLVVLPIAYCCVKIAESKNESE